jgi:hypothetical protein
VVNKIAKHRSPAARLLCAQLTDVMEKARYAGKPPLAFIEVHKGTVGDSGYFQAMSGQPPGPRVMVRMARGQREEGVSKPVVCEYVLQERPQRRYGAPCNE